MQTVDACHLDGVQITNWEILTSDELSSVVGIQAPGGDAEDSSHYHWRVVRISLEEIRYCNEDGEDPEWAKTYLSHKEQDEKAIKDGSPEYAGRAKWLKIWSKNTEIYPLYMVKEDGQYRLWDGYHRLAGAFFHKISHVMVILGEPL